MLALKERHSAYVTFKNMWRAIITNNATLGLLDVSIAVLANHLFAWSSTYRFYKPGLLLEFLP